MVKRALSGSEYLELDSTGWRGYLTGMLQFLRLPEPLSEDPKVRILNALLIALLAWSVLLALVFWPLNFLGRPGFDIAANGFLSATLATALILLRRNSFVMA